MPTLAPVGAKNLPSANGERHAKTFERFGWVRAKKTRGSHIVLQKHGEVATLSIPNHKGKAVKRNLIAKQLKNAGISEQDYCEKFK